MYIKFEGFSFVKNNSTPLSDEDDYETLLIDARLTNEFFGRESFFWPVDRSKIAADADFKKGKYDYWTQKLAAGEEIMTPALYADEGDIGLMDGRHRMMAMMDRGFEKIPVRAPKSLTGLLVEKLGAEVA